MATYQKATLSAAGSSAPLLINVPNGLLVGQSNSIISLGLYVTLSPGASLNYTVQVSGDDPSKPIVNWNNHDTLVNLTASANGNIAYPVGAVRLVVNSYTSGSVNLGIAQWP